MEPSKRGEKQVKGVMVAKLDTHLKIRQYLANSGNSKLVLYRSTLLPRIKHNQNKVFKKKKKQPYLKYWKTTRSLRASGPKKRKAQECKRKIITCHFFSPLL